MVKRILVKPSGAFDKEKEKEKEKNEKWKAPIEKTPSHDNTSPHQDLDDDEPIRINIIYPSK